MRPRGLPVVIHQGPEVDPLGERPRHRLRRDLLPDARDQGDVWFVDKPARNDLHPTMKPVALIERAIRNSSKSRDIVLDPFGGSGSTLIACEKTGRQARLLELDPKYCDVIVRRFQGWAGEQAVLQGDGQSFEEIAAGREAAAA